MDNSGSKRQSAGRQWAQDIQGDPLASQVLPELLEFSTGAQDERAFFEAAIQLLCQATSSRYVALLQGSKGRWRPLAESGESAPLPWDALSETLDRGSPVSSPPWWLAPLPEGEGRVLALRAPQLAEGSGAQLGLLLGVVGAALRARLQAERASQRLRAMLEITASWNQSREADQLLLAMAETSTRLLGAERATIFLWDRQNATLIGRPALGVEGGELRLRQDAGVVGRVVQSGQPMRVDEDIADEQAQIDRRVDRKLKYQTRSLLCVPLVGSKGDVIGAFELINKRGGHFSDEDQMALCELAGHAAVAIENTRHLEQLVSARRQVANEAADKVRLIGDSPAMVQLQSTIERIAQTDLAVLILGENGTGKEVIAQRIHYRSQRRDNVLVTVNCAALAETLLESELFGHEKGAFTDAHQAREGKFELADGGTLLLDEIGDMSPSGQAKLLRVLEEKLIVRVGGSQPISTDVRVIAATNQDLAELVRQKKFREDLFFRLNVVVLQLPPLRERGDDVQQLADHFLREFSARARRRPPTFSAAARKRLAAHRWPGNVRELRNQMERLAYLFPGDVVDAGDLAFVMTASVPEASPLETDQTLAEATRTFQCMYIERQIRRAAGNMTEAAAQLGLHRSNLYRKMKQLGMAAEDPAEE